MQTYVIYLILIYKAHNVSEKLTESEANSLTSRWMRKMYDRLAATLWKLM